MRNLTQSSLWSSGRAAVIGAVCAAAVLAATPPWPSIPTATSP